MIVIWPQSVYNRDNPMKQEATDVKKFICFVLKMMAVLAVVGAAALAVVAYWDKITELFESIRSSVCEKRACRRSSEFEDYQDWEE